MNARNSGQFRPYAAKVTHTVTFSACSLRPACRADVRNVAIGLLEAWPLAILVDGVLTSEPKGDWIHDAFLALLPGDKLGQIVGLVLIGLGLQVIGYASWMARQMLDYHLNYWGTTRVRFALFDKLQELGFTYHRTRWQGDSIHAGRSSRRMF